MRLIYLTRELRERFRREAQAAAKCLHPNIVTIFDFGEEQGIPYIAMEYIDGQELKSYLHDHKTLTKNSTACHAVQILDA